MKLIFGAGLRIQLHQMLHRRRPKRQSSNPCGLAFMPRSHALTSTCGASIANSKLLADTAKAYEAALTLTESRLAGKIASPVDVARAQSQLATARVLIADTAARRSLLEHALATLIGKPASSFSIRPLYVELHLPKRPEAVPSTLLERRPDIAAAERSVAAANEQIGVAKAAFYPRFFLNLSGGTQDTGLHLLDLKNEFFSLGPSVTLPIFDGGKRNAQLDFAIAARDAAAAQYRAHILQAVQEVEDNLALDHWLKIEAKRVDEAVASTQKVLDLSLTLYRDGATNYLDVVTAQTAALDAERTSLDLRTRRLQASIALYLALGGGWRGPIANPDVKPKLIPAVEILRFALPGFATRNIAGPNLNAIVCSRHSAPRTILS